MKTTEQLRGDLNRKERELKALKGKDSPNVAAITKVKNEIAFIKQCLKAREQTETK